VHVRALLLALAGHLGTYRELEPVAALEYRSAWLRSMVLTVVAVLTCLAGCVVLWVAGLVALWNTPWLLTYIVASGAVWWIVSAVALFGALARARDAQALRNTHVADGIEADVFPRSTAMRFLVVALPAAAMLWWRGRLVRGLVRSR
jgi:hypothetical protein